MVLSQYGVSELTHELDTLGTSEEYDSSSVNPEVPLLTMKFRKLLLHLAPALLLLAFSTTSFAAAANGSFGFAIFGCCSVTSSPANDLMNATDLTFGSAPNLFISTNDPLTFGNPNDFQSLFLSAGSLLPITLDLTGGSNSVTTTFGPSDIYSFTATSQTLTLDIPTRSISFYFLGQFVDSTSTFDPAAASLTLQFSQSAPNTSISGAGTFSTPPAPLTGTPEPASMALLGSALIAIGVYGRKRIARR